MGKPQIVAAVSAAALALVAGFEGLRHRPYDDTGGVPTVCYGYTHNVEQRWYSQQECDSLLLSELKAAGAVVHRMVGPLPQPTFDAMSSFVYNVGAGNFQRSTMARRLKAGDIKGACDQLLRWVYVAGKDCRDPGNNCRGIVLRRQAEYSLCMQGV